MPLLTSNRVQRMLLGGVLVALVQGCATPADKALANPLPLHKTGTLPASFDERNPEHLALRAANELTLRYYKAMQLAAADNAAAPVVQAYVDEGLALVEVYCLRWFGQVAEAQRRLELSDTNRNVISQLGTTLIGVARLHPDVTSVYGAGLTALTGFNANVSTAFLVAPNAENVKRLALDGLSKSAATLAAGGERRPTRFADAYAKLESHADNCTYAEVKRLTTQSVDSKETEADKKTGKLHVVPLASSLRAQATTLRPRVEAALDSIDRLSAADAIVLARLLPFRKELATDIQGIDPAGRRMTDDRAARAVAKMALLKSATSDERAASWEALLNHFAP